MEGIRLSPDFGTLSGMRVLCTGSLIAMPFAASMLAEHGAEVIQLERPGRGDNFRAFPPLAEGNGERVGAGWIQEARNRLSVTMELNLRRPEAKELFLSLIEKSDVFMENMVWLEKFGILDEELMARNPRLVIVHITGYGTQRFGGLPEICASASYDLIGQAYSGFMQFNGEPDRPYVVGPSHNDYVTALFTLFGTLSAYIRAKETGRGQIVDVSQFEAQAKILQAAFTRETLGLGPVRRNSGYAQLFQPYGIFTAADGSQLVAGVIGESVFLRFMDAVGLDAAQYPYAEVSVGTETIRSPLGLAFRAAIEKWFSAHMPEEILEIMRRHRVPCCRVNTSGDCLKEEHFLSRGDFITYRDETLGEDVTAFGVVPKFSETPGEVWRGAPRLGQDTERVLTQLLGYTPEKIRALREQGII